MEELLFEFDLRKPPRIASPLQGKDSTGVRDASAGFFITVVGKHAAHQGHQVGAVLSRLMRNRWTHIRKEALWVEGRRPRRLRALCMV